MGGRIRDNFNFMVVFKSIAKNLKLKNKIHTAFSTA